MNVNFDFFDKKAMQKAHQVNRDNGWWEPKPNPGLLASKIIEEVGEAITGLSKQQVSKNLPYSAIASPRFAEHYRDLVKGSFEEELADIVIRCWDYAIGFGLDISKVRDAFAAKEEEYSGYLGNEEVAISLLAKIAKAATNITLRVFCTQYRTPSASEFNLGEILYYVYQISSIYNINIEHHVNLKVAYNATRSHRHGGKKF